MRVLRSSVERGAKHTFAKRLGTLLVSAIVLTGAIGPLNPAPARANTGEQDVVAEQERAYPNGRVVETGAAPITVPVSGADPEGDLSIGGPPLFLPYTPPAETIELVEERGAQTRTLANPDGTFTTEVSDGPINFQDVTGAWQQIDLALIADSISEDYKVAAHAADIRVGTKDGALGAISFGGHTVSLSAPAYSVGAKSEEADSNRVDFAAPAGQPTIWIRPVDIGLEFGATWADATAAPLLSLQLETGDLLASLAENGRTVVFTTVEGKFAGRIDFPILREGSEDAPPILDKVAVSLTPGLSGSFTLNYELDAAWLAAPERVFPVILDPTWCIGEGASGCTDNTTSNSFDTWVFDDDPDSYEIGWTVLRTGYDVRTDEGTYGKMRSILYFPRVALPDGAVIYDTDLQARIYDTFGGAVGETITANRLTKSLSTNFTWTKFGNAFSTTGAASDTVPSSGYMNWDVDDIVTSFYTGRAKLFKQPHGFLLKMSAEGSSHGEVEFRRYNYGTAAYRPLLTISYTLPVVGIDFDARLGPTYAPSSMVVGQPVKLPVIVENKTGSAHTLDKCVDAADTDCWKVGYRWFDGKGNQVSIPADEDDVTEDLLDDVTVDDESNIPILLEVTPPTTTGQYTLVLDVVHFRTGHYWWSSDFASPSLYYSRNKKVLTSSSTRWTGTSAIERDEFSINVTEGAGGSNTQSVAVASGGQIGIDLATKNLSLRADTGIGFVDRIPLAVMYGYNESLAETCTGYQGILGACGWSTNWDERITGGSNQTGFDYSYVDPGGTPAMLDTDDSGQIAGGASVLISRQRVTIFDENGGWDGPDGGTVPDIPAVLGSAESPAITPWSGQYVAKSATTSDVLVYSPDKVSLNVYRKVRFALQTTDATKAGMCFQIDNLSDSSITNRWFCYTVGPSWSAGDDYISITGTIVDTWKYINEDLYEDVRTDNDFGDEQDDYQVIAIRVEGGPSMTGSTYVDGFRFESDEFSILDESNPGWTTGSSATNATDAKVGTNSIKITPGSGITPTCRTSNSCWGATQGGTWVYPFADWYWKKAGGTSAAMVFYLHNERSGAHCNTGNDCTLTYYAGASPTFTPSGAYNAAIRIAPNLPTTWTLVRRNVAADAAQALNLFDDGGTGAADDIRITGWAPVAVDGNNLLIDHFSYGNLADTGTVDPTGPEGGVAGQQEHPATAGDTAFTYDFSADYGDGSRHYFNRDGLLVRIRDRDQQAVKLDWAYDLAKAGPTAYSLTAIHAPTDGTSSGGVTFNRQITVTRGTDGSLKTIRFDEDLGIVGTDPSDRAAIFEITTGATPDLVKVSPARTPPPDPDANGAFCGSRPNGCIEYTYLTTTHRLQYVIDPRWDGGSGASDFRLEVGRTGNDPVSIVDKSHSNAALLNILSFSDTRDGSLKYKRALWQDAAAASMNNAIGTDLNPDGSILTQYVPRGCSGSCGAYGSETTWPATGTQTNYKAADYEYDGLSRVNTVKSYRCPIASDAINGCAGGELITMTRSESNASAKVDNYADPLAGGRMAWRATADQVFASLRDSKGANADWYRTEYVYDGAGQVAETIEARQLEAANYFDAALLSAPSAYWRLGEASPGPFLDSSGNGKSGTAANMTFGLDGAIVRDANKAASFNGTTSKVTNSAVTLSTSAYSMAAWVKASSPDQVSKAIFGRYLSNSGVKVYLKGNGAFGLQHNATLVSSTVVPEVGRWYYLVATWNGAMARLYIDGELVADAVDTSATGAGGSNFEIGTGSNGAAGSFFAGSIDDVQVYASSLAAWRIDAHFRAGRAIATVDTTVQRDSVGRPTETATSFVINPGFEQHTNAWALGASAAIDTTSSTNSGAASLLASANVSSQISQLVAGQTMRFQFATRSSAGSTPVHAKFEYWKTSAAAWTQFGVDTDFTNTSWGAHAYDITLPMDTDGRVKVSFTETGTGSGWVDDVLVVTHWGTVTYNPTAGVGFGMPTEQVGLASCAVGPCSTGTVKTVLQYAANTTNPTYHPAILPTTTIANYQNGVPGSDPFDDVTSTVAYDSWGRSLVSTDPDGVTATTVYAANRTDVAQTKDGLANTTTMTYDAVGNALSTTSPMGRVTTSTYDARNHALTTTGPDSVESQTDYDNYGRATASWTNYVNGAVESGDNDLTDDILSKPTYDAFGHIITSETDCGSVATCNSNGGLAAKSTTTFDLLGNTIASTAYPGAAGTGTARTTTNYFETYDPPSGTEFGSSGVFSRTAATGVRLPISPSASPAPNCPGTGTACNTVSTLDLSNRAVLTTDAYGIVTRTRYDLDGKAVEVTANYGDGVAGPLADDDVVTLAIFDLAGNPAISWDPSGRRDVRTYDILGRLLNVSHVDDTVPGAEYLAETTEYTPAGRVAATFDGSAWTRTSYDGAGRAIRTIANAETGTNAGMTIDALEGTVGAWSTASSGFFTTSAATAKTDDTDAGTSATAGLAYHSVAAVSGRGRLRVTTHATNTNDGAWLDLSGPTYQSGHTYKASFDLAASAPSLSLTAYLGHDQSGSSYGSLGITTTTSWSRYTVSWTASSNFTSPIRFALRKAAAGTSELYLDNLVVWDTTVDVAPPKNWSQTKIVSSASAYNADGEIAVSILPPGDPATERPLVTTVAFDPAGRTVSSVTNGASGAYASIITPTSGLAAYFPLDERVGTTVADKKPGGGTALNAPATLARGVAGGIDEARAAMSLPGAADFLGRSTNATSATTNVSLEAWIRTDTTPGATTVVAANGTAADGWGLAIDAAGNASGFTTNGSTFTTLASNKVVTDGAWHHLVLTRGASTWAIAVDGVAKTLSSNTTSPGTPGAAFTIGALYNGTRMYVGEVDEVAIYTADINGVASAHFAAGRKTDAVSALTTRNAYDRLGRVTDAWAPDLVRTKARYDRLGNQTETVANYQNDVTTGGTAADDVRSTFAYDVLGELIGYCPAVEVKVGSCDPANSSEVQAWHYGFDAMGRQTTTVPPDNTAAVDLTTEEVAYETGGRIAKTCRYVAATSCGSTNSRHTDYTYDDLGRILTQKTWDRAGGSDTLKFTKTLTWNEDGSPATVNEGADTLTYVYDTAGRVSQFKRASTVLTAYTYTTNTSTIATRTDGTQGATAFSYDWARRQTVIDPPDAFVSGTVTRTYRLDGLLATQSFPSSITETLAYDEAKRPTSISLGGAGSISQAFDRTGRITSDGRSLTGITGDAGTGTQSFSYDALSRLTGSTGLAVSRSYQYDLDGNRTRRVEGATTTDFTYDRADQVINQTIGVTTKTYDYDRYGNMLTSADPASAVTTYAYDEANRLKTISPPGGAATQVTFTLDALGRHATRLVNGTLTDTYAYLDATETAHQTGTGTPTTTALLDADGTRLAIKTNGTVSWLVFDLHGSVVALCTSGGSTLSDAYRFDGWGQQIASQGSAVNPYRYRGLLNIGSDALTGALLDMGARDYSPQLGTFTQQDSVQGGAANPMTMNRFLYALANPATLIDPDGHMAEKLGGGESGSSAGTPPIQRDDGSNCSKACIDRGDGGTGSGSNGGNCCSGTGSGGGYEPFDPEWIYSAEHLCAGETDYADCLYSMTRPVDGNDFATLLVVGSVILLCIAACVPIASGIAAAGSAVAAGNAGWALTSYCVQACVATLEAVGFACGLAGTCMGPELGMPAGPRPTGPGSGIGPGAMSTGEKLAGASDNAFVNLVSAERTNHILYGDAGTLGHLWPGGANKTPFPEAWGADKIMHEISDIATDPAAWKAAVPQGPSKWILEAERDGVNIVVIVDVSVPSAWDVKTAWPPDLDRNP